MTRERLDTIQGMAIYLASLQGNNLKLADKMRQKFNIHSNGTSQEGPSSTEHSTEIEKLPKKETV